MGSSGPFWEFFTPVMSARGNCGKHTRFQSQPKLLVGVTHGRFWPSWVENPKQFETIAPLNSDHMFSRKKWSHRVVKAGFLIHPRTKPWFFHTQGMSWGVWKNHSFDNCLEKFGCTNHTVKKSFFYVLLNFQFGFFQRWPWAKSFGQINPLSCYWSILIGEKIWNGV